MNKVQFITCDSLVLTIYHTDIYIVYTYLKHEFGCGDPSTYYDIMTVDKCYRNCYCDTLYDIDCTWTDSDIETLLNDIENWDGRDIGYQTIEILQDDIATIPVPDRIRNKDIIKWIWNNNQIIFSENDLYEVQVIVGRNTKSAANI